MLSFDHASYAIQSTNNNLGWLCLPQGKNT
jgi:hypothetical protein